MLLCQPGREIALLSITCFNAGRDGNCGVSFDCLMKNQVDAIRGISNHEGIAHVLNSSLNKTEIKQVKSDIESGITKLIICSSRIAFKSRKYDVFKRSNISFMAVDEAHCISEWGHDFRPEYRNLKHIITQIGDNIPIIGLTATATPKVQEDILKNLGTTDAQTFKASFNRPNCIYEILPKTDKLIMISFDL